MYEASSALEVLWPCSALFNSLLHGLEQNASYRLGMCNWRATEPNPTFTSYFPGSHLGRWYVEENRGIWKKQQLWHRDWLIEECIMGVGLALELEVSNIRQWYPVMGKSAANFNAHKQPEHMLFEGKKGEALDWWQRAWCHCHWQGLGLHIWTHAHSR